MGLMGNLIGGAGTVAAAGQAARDVAEVFTPSATRRLELSAEAQIAALQQMGEEYQMPALGWFDRFINGLNRLPRPFLAFGTIGLFVYAMRDPVGFSARMVGLNAVPEPLWWLLGAVVAFYFGARETWYFRNRSGPVADPGSARPPLKGGASPDDNAALRDWRAGDR